MPDDILTKVDRMSMAHSLEVRSPFLDHTLVEFMAKLPRSEKFTLFDRKRLLKEVARRYLPDKIVNRSKKGFSIPLGEWLRGPLLPWLEQVLLSGNALERNLFRYEGLRKLIDDHVMMKRDYSQQLWALIILELWFEKNEKSF